MKTLTIISHTEHYKTTKGDIVGLSSTVTEINNLLEIFDEIFHVAMLHSGPATDNALPYQSDKIKFVSIPVVGGTNLKDKLLIVTQALKILSIVNRTIKQTDYFQFRSPTGIGVFVIPYLILFSSKKGWFKYAGNWKQYHAPLAYRFQQWLLKTQKQRPVTINGFWKDQPKQCLTFENPCLTTKELKKGQLIIHNKLFNNELIDFCFVGRLEKEKGLDILLDAFHKLEFYEKEKINNIHIVGYGKEIEKYKEVAKKTGINIIFHGFLSRSKVHAIYETSHAIILPSASEGFPKVIAEAMNYGCLPVVSKISSIGHYIKDEENGFLLEDISVQGLTKEIRKVLSLNSIKFTKMIKESIAQLDKFTYSYYNKRIKNDILNQ